MDQGYRRIGDGLSGAAVDQSTLDIAVDPLGNKVPGSAEKERDQQVEFSHNSLNILRI
jgi:hypothetical protein